MKRYILGLVFGAFLLRLSAQERTILSLEVSEIETIFMQQNLALIAEKMNISIADAAIVQAKLWDNPSISIEDVNLWSTEEQREEADIPPLFGSFAKNTQFSIELSQIIAISGRRSKLVSKEKVSKEIAIKQFEELIRALKIELRKSVSEIIYIDEYLQVMERQSKSLEQLIASYQQLYDQGNLSKNHLIRLQSALLSLLNDINENQLEFNARQKELKNLLNVEPWVTIKIVSGEKKYPLPDTLKLVNLLDLAVETRADMVMARLQTELRQKSLTYEKSLRIPDLNLMVKYERSGVWKNFIGFGVGMDIPVFNRNQGGIQTARLEQEQSILLAQQQEKLVRNEVIEAYENYTKVYAFYNTSQYTFGTMNLDEVLENYTRNLLEKNISMVEYMDFMEAYRETKELQIMTKKKLNQQFEELQYTVGAEIN